MGMFRFNQISSVRSFSIASRLWSGPQTTSGTDAEKKIKTILNQRFPSANSIAVTDISGGCGAMFEIMIEDKAFKGLTTIKQHRLVNEALKEEIKDMHGLRIHTAVPT